jgi:hypothetical protein
MQLHNEKSEISGFSRCFVSPICCSYCGDRLIAPEVSEFVDSGEIRHHWTCGACGRVSHTSLKLVAQ